jgi:cysteinyl-tRNA synthetase
MKIYNTLTRYKEEFVPVDENMIKIYSCGPTVYQYAHIGNLRTYIFMDLLRRALKYQGYSILHVMNITDVGHLVSDSDEGEDKMLKTSREQQKSPWEIAKFYSDKFFSDVKALNIEIPELTPKATDNIQEMIDFVQELLEKGFAYKTSDGIYFDIMKFGEYGRLSRIDLEGQIAGARVEVNDEKKHPADFALWKNAPKEHIMQWDSPWGMGYPGWHIECSAMSLKFLGELFDIHTGGVDHIPVHHENEIAQSEALLGKRAVNYWMHGEFLLVDNGKMSKSLGNTYTVADLEEKGYSPLVFRYFCLNAHYRNKLNFTWQGMDSAKISYERLVEGVHSNKNGETEIDSSVLENIKEEFYNAVSDDLNIPKALGVLWNVIRCGAKSKQLYDIILEFDSILGLDLQNAENLKGHQIDIPKDIQLLVEERDAARKSKDWKKSDEIRDKLKELGVTVEDTADGPKITMG